MRPKLSVTEVTVAAAAAIHLEMSEGGAGRESGGDNSTLAMGTLALSWLKVDQKRRWCHSNSGSRRRSRRRKRSRIGFAKSGGSTDGAVIPPPALALMLTPTHDCTAAVSKLLLLPDKLGKPERWVHLETLRT